MSRSVPSGPRPPDERPLYVRSRGWPAGWRHLAWVLFWPALLASRLWEDGAAPPGRRVAAVAAGALGAPWFLALAVSASLLVPAGEDELPVEVPPDLFAPLDQPIEPAPTDG